MVAFDLIALQGDDLRNEPLFNRKQRLARILSRGPEAIVYNEHVTFDGPTVFEHACRPAGGHRLKAAGRALPQWAVKSLAQVQKSSQRSGPSRTRGGLELKHRDIEYTIVQGLGRQLWKWTATIISMTARGQAATKPEAIADAERAIDRALAPKKLKLVRPDLE